MLVALVSRTVSLMPPGQVIDTQHRVYQALKLCPLEQDARMVTQWAMHNAFLDVVYELGHNGFLPAVTLWVASLLLFTWICMSKL